MGRFNGQVKEDSLPYNAFEKGNMRVGVYFKVNEFRTEDGSGAVLIHPRLISLLYNIRDRIGEPLYINSGYRNVSYNRKINGASKSRHLYGMAADASAENTTPEEIAQIAEELDVGGIGLYNTFTHLDVEGYNRRWDYRT